MTGKAWEVVKGVAAKTFAWLGVAGVVAAVVVLAVAGAEVRRGFRAACGSPEAGWLTQRACDAFDVVELAPAGPVELKDSDAAEDAERYVAPACTTAQAIEILDLERKDLATLERTLQRDLDGDGRTGSVTRRPRPLPAKGGSAGFELDERGAELLGAGGAGELVVADKDVPELPRGGRLVGTVPVAGGPVRVDVVPNPVPDFELLGDLTFRLAGSLPVGDYELGDRLEASLAIDVARWKALRGGVELFGERVNGVDDWGVLGALSARCRGLHCRPE